jgi:protein-S-isoprenylcysteine O-methyltransferase Ste14
VLIAGRFLGSLTAFEGIEAALSCSMPVHRLLMTERGHLTITTMRINIITMLLSALWLGSEIVLAVVKRAGTIDDRLDRSSFKFLWATILLSITAAVVLRSLQIAPFGRDFPFFPIAGILLILCGSIIRWLAILTLKRHFTVNVSIRSDHHLVRHGVYRHVRHPSYTGSLLSFFGLGLSLGDFLSLLVILVPISLAFLYRITVEEKALLDAFGNEYLEYRTATSRLIPGLF